MKTIVLYTLIIIASLKASSVNAQTYSMNWGTNFSPAWSAGSTSTRTTTNIGGSGVTATVATTMSESTACSSFGGFTSPQVSASGFPFSTTLGSNSSNLAVGMNLSNNTGYVELTITFSSTVTSVNFNIADIDKNDPTSLTYLDEVVVTGFNGLLQTTNPTLSKLNGTATNATTDTVLISGNIARANATNNRGGNSPSSSADQNSTVRVNFGIVTLNKIVIRYRNASGAQANPAQQAIGIGNIGFNTLSSLPVQYTSFTGSYNNNTISLNWQTAQEVNAAKFVIEKSIDGQNFSAIAEVAAGGNSSTAKNYQVTDTKPYAVNYYRIKQVDLDGKADYSKIVIVNGAANKNVECKLYPNPVTNKATISLTSNTNETVQVNVFNTNGMLINKFNVQVKNGVNTIDLPSVSNLAKGVYIASISNSQERIASISFAKN